jgi:N-acetylmuramoyl-L-alanine amidase
VTGSKLLCVGEGQSKCDGLFTYLKFTSLFSLLILGTGSLAAAKEKIRFTLVHIEKRSYLSLANLKRVHGDLTVKYNQGEEQGEIRFGKRIILFALNKAEYQSQSEIRELDSEGVIEDDGLFFSREFVEEILTELSLPVSYRFQKNNLIIVRDKQREGVQKLDFIFIDAGHGGRDSGALGYFDAAEKDITLSLAHALKAQLAADYPKIKIYLTRSGDRFIRLEKRSELANKKSTPGNFGIFISIHCNSHLSPKVKGFEIYYLAQNPDNKQARELALRENQSFEKSGYIKRLTSQLMNAQIQRESKTLARQVFQGILNRLDGMIKPRKVKKADFAVLRGSLMPAILIETGYLTNRDDLKKLRSSEYSKAFAAGVSRGIGAFLGELSKAEK